MKFFERIFASCYFLLLEVKRFTKSRSDEDYGALLILISSQLMPIYCILFFLKIRGLVENFNPPPYLIILVSLIFLGIGYLYFLSNRKRRNRIIDEYRVLSTSSKKWWTIIPFVFLFLPVLIIIIFQ